jgi:hypothetical protein
MSENTSQSTETEQRLTRDSFGRIVAECKRFKELAQDYSGQLGAWIRTNAERYSLNKAALAVFRRGDAMDPAKEADFIRSTIQYWELGGKFDQIDAFDDLRTLIDRIHARLNPTHEPTQAEVNTQRLKGIKALDSLTSAA